MSNYHPTQHNKVKTEKVSCHMMSLSLVLQVHMDSEKCNNRRNIKLGFVAIALGSERLESISLLGKCGFLRLDRSGLQCDKCSGNTLLMSEAGLTLRI